MLLADTSVWIDHLRHDDAQLRASLLAHDILCHPFIIGEIAMGSLKDRAIVLRFLKHLPGARPAKDDEVFDLIERHRLFSRGLGYVDAHLLAATMLTPEALLWTRDQRLHDAATRLNVAAAMTN
ncbi:type II toxin-antitoxin system VapC family toxin [Sphingomonas sp. RT2P30]|uniref:type II toxin-antitoxin system VapC family toxin n=1 Tax=Parasphingomonas halimpatiens TaxID=3096162 RepID=UPI002FC5E3BF